MILAKGLFSSLAKRFQRHREDHRTRFRSTSANVHRWTKLPKNGSKRQSLIAHLQQQGLGANAAKYAQLRQVVVDFLKTSLVRREPSLGAPPEPYPVAVDAEWSQSTWSNDQNHPQRPNAWADFTNWSRGPWAASTNVSDGIDWSNGYQQWSASRPWAALESQNWT